MASTGTQPNAGKVTELEVFKQLCEWRSRYADNRFKQLTLWIGAMTLLVTAGFHRESGLSLQNHSLIIPSLGILLTSAFWIMEVCSTVKEIEVLESLRPYRDLIPGPTLNHWTFLNHTNVTLLLYLSAFVLWTILAKSGGLKAWEVLAITLWGALLLAFTIREYAHLWRHAARHLKW
jgi:sterol desaturase/sphingolipid hydroxylase (fatty acid hydroxylase superfamily)